MFGGAFNKRACPIGVDVGSHHVKLLQLERVGEGHRVVAAAVSDLPTDLSHGSDEYHRAVTAALLEARQAGPFVGKAAVSALPADAVQYKNLRLPKMPGKDLAAAVRWEAGDRLKLSGKSFTVQYFDAGEVRQGDEERQEVIMLAADTGFIEHHTTCLTAAGLMPLAIDAVPGAIARCFNSEPGTDAARVAVDIGYSSTKVLIVRGGRVLFFKLIDIGGKHFDEAVARHLNVPRSEVTALRRQIHEAEDQVPEHIRRAIQESVRGSVAELGREIGLCLRYYSVTFRGRRPERADVVGGEAGQPWLEKMLAEQAGVDVHTADPLAGIDCSAVESVIGRMGPAWAVAAGLSLRSTDTGRTAAGREAA